MTAAQISEDDVRKVASLARLALGDEEVQRLRGQLNAMLEHFAELDAFDVSQVSPTFQVLEGPTPFRADEPRPSLLRDEALAAAPAVESDGFAVPRVLEVE